MATATPGGRNRGGRREAILEAAAELFSEHGYAATGIDEIGEAAGITGPGVYRHFENKHDVLNEVVRRAINRVVEGVADVVSEADDEWQLLEGLIDNMIESVLEDRAAWAVLVREQRHLDPVSMRGLAKAHRLHIQEWVDALAEVRSDLTETQQRAMVHGVLGVTAPFAARYDTGLGQDRLVAILSEMAMCILRDSSVVEP